MRLGLGNRHLELRFRYVRLTTQVAQVVDHDAGSAVIRSMANDWNGARLVDWTGSGANQRFYGTNAHRDVTWTASDTGTVTNTLRYDPWGTLTNSSGTALPDFRFQGNWFDTQTSLSWIVNRWYAPALARFISEDSLLGDPADPPSRHLYAYGLGDPINFVDPSGRAAAFLVDGGYGEGASSWTAAKVKGHMQTRSRNKKYARVRSGAIVHELGRRAPVASVARIRARIGTNAAARSAHGEAMNRVVRQELIGQLPTEAGLAALCEGCWQKEARRLGPAAREYLEDPSVNYSLMGSAFVIAQEYDRQLGGCHQRGACLSPQDLYSEALLLAVTDSRAFDATLWLVGPYEMATSISAVGTGAGPRAPRSASGAASVQRPLAGETHAAGAPTTSMSWTTARRAYWKEHGVGGVAPTRTVYVRHTRTGRAYIRQETMELDHIVPRRHGGSHHPSNLRPLWPTQHAAVDRYRHPGYEVLWVLR